MQLTAKRLVEANAFPENLKEVLANLWSEDGGILLFDRSRLVDLELALVVQIDQSIMGVGHAE